MLSKEDIKQLREVLATKEDINGIKNAVEELALSTAKGFAGNDKRFDKIESKLNDLEISQEGIKQEIDDFNSRILNIEHRVNMV